MIADTQRERRLSWDACYNARDTGGYATDDGGTTRWGALLRSDNLSRLTQHGRDALITYGVRTIVDVRSHFELFIDPPPFATDVDNGSVTYLHLELMNDDAAQASTEVETALDTYRLIVDRCRGEIAAIIRAIAQAPEGAVLIHCHAGKDRTGLVVALLLALAGVPPETIAADYALSDTYLRPLHTEMLDNAADDPGERDQLVEALSSRPETMIALLDHLDSQYGGVQPYIRGCGVSAEQIQDILHRLRA